MAIPHSHLTATIRCYLDDYPDQTTLAPLFELLAADVDPTNRHTAPGHLTCGAAVFAPDGTVLHIRQHDSHMWLLPGGHCEPSDDSLRGAALRELAEETGIAREQLIHWEESEIVEVDVHPIPARNGEPAHWHANIVYAFAAPNRLVVTPQHEEIAAYEWLAREDSRISGLVVARGAHMLTS